MTPLLSAGARDKLDVAVRLSPDDTPTLEFVIRNRTDRSITLLEATLPWVDGSIGLFLDASSDGVALQSISMVHGTDRTLSIPIGGELNGRLKLSSRLPSLCAALKGGDVALNWRFRPALTEKTSPEFSGMLEIKKRQSCSNEPSSGPVSPP